MRKFRREKEDSREAELPRCDGWLIVRDHQTCHQRDMDIDLGT
jgi:hypothetical protein